MLYCIWENDNWDTLIYAIQKKNCILMLGPDAATEMEEGKHRPLTESLANELAEIIKEKDLEKINTSDLAQVSQFYCMNKGRLSLEARVSSFYEKRESLDNTLYQNLAALPFYLTVTTTPDRMFLEALKKEGKIPIVEWYHFNGKNSKMARMGTVEKPLVFYLYGFVDEPDSLVLTENDLLDFLVRLISGKRPMPFNILSELQNMSKNILFLGFGFRHWYQRILLHVLQGRKKESPSYAMEQFTPEYTPLFKQTVFFFERSDYKIHIFNQSLDKFAALLREKIGESPSVCTPQNNNKGVPTVFICHTDEDKDFAAFLHEELEAAGLSPWLDRENLMGGDDWDLKIEETIKKVDYVLVLQSKALAKKHEGYVIKEIRRALARKEYFQEGFRFIIPVKIDESSLLYELKGFQSVDLRVKSNVNKLIDAITRDFKKRRNI